MSQSKKQLQDVEAVQNEIVGQAHLENYALKLFLYADNEDRAARFGKYVAFQFLICTRFCSSLLIAFSARTLLVGHQEEHLAFKKLSDEVLAWLFVRSEMQMIRIWSS